MAIWHAVGTVKTKTLVDSRLQAHWAVQIPAAAGDGHLEQRDDDSQSNLGWNDEHQALLGQILPNGMRTGIRVADLTVLLVEANLHLADSFSLDGITMRAGLEQLSIRLTAHGLPSKKLQVRDYDIPTHAVANGELFLTDTAGLTELSNWFANAHQLFGAFVLNEPAAGAVRCWPHHFDMATLINFDPEKEPENARSVGVGLSPGDANYPEPYFYVNPWPYPEPSHLPPLTGSGHWHTDGWIGAVLPADKLFEVPTSEQLRRAEQHVVEALHACTRMLGVSEVE